METSLIFLDVKLLKCILLRVLIFNFAKHPLISKLVNDKELPLLESSTQYRVTFDCDVEGIELMVSLGGTSQTITSALHNELSFITPSLQTDGKLTIDGYGIAKIDNVLITKGDMEYKYFEGLKSGFENERKNKIIEVEKGFINNFVAILPTNALINEYRKSINQYIKNKKRLFQVKKI